MYLLKQKTKTVEIIYHFNNIIKTPSAIAIGMFDGVHIGHQKILNQLLSVAKNKGLQSVLFTFSPHPRQVLEQNSTLRLILSNDEKIDILKKFNIDRIVVQPFTKEFAQNSAEYFIKHFLVDPLQMKHLIIGHDQRIGKNKESHFDDLKTLGKSYHFEVEQVKAQHIGSEAISSTKIRNAVLNRDLSTANTYMNRAFQLTGKVVHGHKIGRKMGFPTANILVDSPYKLIPPIGVYLVCSFIQGKRYWGMLSIGKNPTIKGKGESIEVHFFDFQGDLYGITLTIYFLEYLRNELKFNSLEQLKNQLATDERVCKNYIDENIQNYLALT